MIGTRGEVADEPPGGWGLVLHRGQQALADAGSEDLRKLQALAHRIGVGRDPVIAWTEADGYRVQLSAPWQLVA